MELLIFLVVLVVLIVVHELGHFFVAKWSGMHVEEFGIGYPPRAWGKKIGDTVYSINWLPLGGFVKIQGEDGEELKEGEVSTKVPGKSFGDKSHFKQILVLVAGVAMNLVLAYILLSSILAIGLPRALSDENISRAPDATLTVAGVLPGSPAGTAEILAGDKIVKAYAGLRDFEGTDATAFTEFIAATEPGEPVALELMRGDETILISAIPTTGIVTSEPDRAALGVSLAVVGTVPLSIPEAFVEGLSYTWQLTKLTTLGLIDFFGSIFTFSADLSQVSGPVGIATTVGDASRDGIVSLLFITALISINLAIINLLPIPALDGGRLLFVIIEMVIRRPIPPQYTMYVNAAGFAFLLLLMLVVTISDVSKFF